MRLNAASRTRSLVGRVSCPFGAKIRAPLRDPEMIRMPSSGPLRERRIFLAVQHPQRPLGFLGHRPPAIDLLAVGVCQVQDVRPRLLETQDARSEDAPEADFRRRVVEPDPDGGSHLGQHGLVLQEVPERLGSVRAHDVAVFGAGQRAGEQGRQIGIAAEAEHVCGGGARALVPFPAKDPLDSADGLRIALAGEGGRGLPALPLVPVGQRANEAAALKRLHAPTSFSAKTRSTSSASGPSYSTSSSAAVRARSRSGRSLRQWTKRRSESPDWRVPKSWPSPRSSRSFSASSNPSVESTSACSRAWALSVSSSCAREIRRQYDCSAPRPTRPRSWCS